MLQSIVDGYIVLLDADDRGVMVKVAPLADPTLPVAIAQGAPSYEQFLGGVPVNPLAVIEKVREAIDGFKANTERAKINRAVVDEVAKALGGVWEVK